jgi:hypothetical protein
LSTLVAWTRSLVSTYLFGLTKDSTGTSEGSKLRCQVGAARCGNR